MRKSVVGAAAVALSVVGMSLLAASAGAAAGQTANEQQFVVVYAAGASTDAAHAAIAAAGGTVLKENTAIGVATVATTNAGFAADATAAQAIEGVAHNQAIGTAPDQRGADARSSTRRRPTSRRGRRTRRGTPPARRRGGAARRPAVGHAADRRHRAGSQRYEQGKGVRVGIIDTGVDGSHPDIAPNFDAKLSRNFTTDIPVDADGNEIDGPCEHPSCVDPPDEDDDGHGTHVASEIASPVNGLGIAGVAPKATIVNLRAGQDSGYFFLQPSLDALTYAGDHGIDVVNMSYYVDPWLFNCRTTRRTRRRSRRSSARSSPRCSGRSTTPPPWRHARGRGRQRRDRLHEGDRRRVQPGLRLGAMHQPASGR